MAVNGSGQLIYTSSTKNPYKMLMQHQATDGKIINTGFSLVKDIEADTIELKRNKYIKCPDNLLKAAKTAEFKPAKNGMEKTVINGETVYKNSESKFFIKGEKVAATVDDLSKVTASAADDAAKSVAGDATEAAAKSGWWKGLNNWQKGGIIGVGTLAGLWGLSKLCNNKQQSAYY